MFVVVLGTTEKVYYDVALGLEEKYLECLDSMLKLQLLLIERKMKRSM